MRNWIPAPSLSPIQISNKNIFHTATRLSHFRPEYQSVDRRMPIVILILKQCFFCGIAARNYRQIQCSMLAKCVLCAMALIFTCQKNEDLRMRFANDCNQLMTFDSTLISTNECTASVFLESFSIWWRIFKQFFFSCSFRSEVCRVNVFKTWLTLLASIQRNRCA